MKAFLFPSLCAAVLVAMSFVKSGEPAPAAGLQLAHMVFFELNENTPQSRDKLAAACKKYLSGHEGTVYFSVGTLAEDLKRDVNDRAFQVALHVVFANRAAHDKYQTHERHVKFIEENKALWKKVRVFDSNVAPGGSKEK